MNTKKRKGFLERKNGTRSTDMRLETVLKSSFCNRLEFLLEWKLKEVRKKSSWNVQKTMANCACVYIFFKDVTKVCAWNYSFVKNCSFPELLVHGTEFVLGTFGKPFFYLYQSIHLFLFCSSTILITSW